MCRYASFVVTEDKIYFPKEGLGGNHSHTVILKDNGLRDDEHHNHVSCELTPLGELNSTDPDEWEFVVDTDKGKLPVWWTDDKRKAVEYEAREMLVAMTKGFDCNFKYGLDCPYSPNLTTIGNVGGYLNCPDCPKLTTIGNVSGNLDCPDSPNLTTIGNVGGYLNCPRCPNLTTIGDVGDEICR